MALPPDSKEGASFADFLHLLRLRQALIFLILALVVLTTVGVTAFATSGNIYIDGTVPSGNGATIGIAVKAT